MFNLMSLVFVGVLSVPVFAAVPNLYRCTGIDSDIEVSYSSTSYVGTPQFGVTVNGEQLIPLDEFHKVTLRTDGTVHGRMVSAFVMRTPIADAPSRVISLLIPGIELGQDSRGVQFETILLTGVSGGFLALPAVYQRIDEVYRVSCTGSKVFF